MRCGARSGWVRLGVARPGCWLLPFLKCRFAGPMTSSSVRTRFALRLALDRPVYDCVYLALAHRIGATLATADTRFANAVAATEHGGGVAILEDLVMGPE